MDTIRVASWSQEITEQVNLLAADEKPFFKDEKINLTFVPGSGSSDAIKNMLAGNADIAFADAGSFFSALDQGEDLVAIRSEEHTSELQYRFDFVCRLLLE